MPEVEEYKKWLASGITNREVVETFDIYHPVWKHWRVVNSDREIEATIEDGTRQRFIAGRFYMEPSETTDTIDQVTTVAVSALGGRLYDTIRQLTFEERMTPITATYRLYFLDDPSVSLVSPPPVWYVASMDATLEAVRFQLQATQMRVQRIGLYYTAREFPTIVYI
jgi:hypothetical protein